MSADRARAHDWVASTRRRWQELLDRLADVIEASLGLATRTVQAVGDAESLVGLADAQLYLAKQTGRGRVCGAKLDALVSVRR